MDELKVKAGDKVLYKVWTIGGIREQIETVAKVTPTGRIRIEGIKSQFNKYGIEMVGDSWRSAATLSIPTDKDYKRVKENAVIEEAISLMGKMNKKTLSYEKAVKIVEILGKDF